MRILVVRLSALGDLVHTLPAVAALRHTFPNCQIDWLVDERLVSVLSLVPAIDRPVAWPRLEPDGVVGYERVLSDLRDQRYDVALDVQGLLKSATAAWLSGARRVVGFERSHLREPTARWFYTETVPVDGSGHVIEKNLTLAAHLGGEIGGCRFPIRVPASARVAETRQRLALGEGEQFVLLNPGAAWPSKCWSPSRYGALASRLWEGHRLRSVVSWGPGEESCASQVVATSNQAAALASPTTLVDLVSLLDAAALVVAGDTGPLHLATALGTPVVGIYGPSDPARNGPWPDADCVVSSLEGCHCRREATRAGSRGVVVRQCHQSRRCLDDVAVDDVVGAVLRRLGSGRA